MSRPCQQDGCTVEGTGLCLLNNDPATCPQRAPELEVADTPPPVTVDDLEDLPAPISEFMALSVSRELGLADLRALMRRRYCHLIGILGAPGAGKTSAIVSLYLLAANGKLDGFEFRNSESMMALEQLARGARTWAEGGGMLKEIVPHTELEDPRSPGFLHLRLSYGELGPSVDVVFPDLPGEWTTELINTSDDDRWAFLHRAEVIWIVLDGKGLSTPGAAQEITYQAEQLIGRLDDVLQISKAVPLIGVITRRDTYEEIDAAWLTRIEREATDRGYGFKFTEIASFSEDLDRVIPGVGIPDLLRASFPSALPRASESGQIEAAMGDRQVLRYRRTP